MAEKTIEEQIKEAVEAAEKGLKNKNKDLLKELKETQTTLKKFDGVDLKILQKAAKDLKKFQDAASKKEGDYKKLYNEQSIQHKTELEKSTVELQKAQDSLSTEKKSNALTQALAANHVKADLIESSVLILTNKVAINDDGVAMVGDKTISDFVKDWTVNDIGKNFITDPNEGGDAGGQGGTGDTDAQYYDPNSPNYNMSEQGKIANADLAKHQALAKAAPAKK